MQSLVILAGIWLWAGIAQATDLVVPIQQFDCEDGEAALRNGPGDLGPIKKFHLTFAGIERNPSVPPKQLFTLSLSAKQNLIIYFTALSHEEATRDVDHLRRAHQLIYEGPCLPTLRVDGEDFAPARDPDIQRAEHWTAAH